MKSKSLKPWMPILFAAFVVSGTLTTYAELLVPRHSSWKYNNLNQDLGTDWRGTNYNDSLWGGPLPGPLGSNNEAGLQLCTSVISIGADGARYPVIYYRSTFTVAAASAYSGLVLRLNRDDTAVVYLNGAVLKNDGVPEPVTFSYSGGTAAAGADETNYFVYPVSASLLVTGTNVLAVENHQQAATSSDLQFDLELEGLIDNTPPTVTSIDPPAGFVVLSLTFINITFSEGVRGVNASDLLINSVPASGVTTNAPNDYTFTFPSPPTGVVQVAWAPGHGITDLSVAANPFAGGNWTYKLDPNAVQVDLKINEFMADNNHGITDDDGNHSDWLELANFGTISANLDGYFLTDNPTNLTKWRLPAAFLDANNYLLVWASGKDRTNPAAPLHTSFKLAKEAGNYLALVDPNTNVISEFNPYPAQQSDVSYGRNVVDPTMVGYFATPTPGARNSITGAGFAPDPVFSLNTGVYTNASLTLTITAPSGSIYYSLDGKLPTGTNGILYSGPITFSTNMTIKALVVSSDTNLFPGQVVGRNFVFLDGTTVDFNSNLPLMIISTEGRTIPTSVPPGGNRAKGSLTVIDVNSGKSSLQSAPEFQGPAEFEYYGQTSIGFPKPPVRIQLRDDLGNTFNAPLLGMPADNDWKTRNPYDDKSLMNDFLGFELHEQMGHYAVRRRYVEIFIDTGGGRLSYPGDYFGVETLMETIKVGNNRVDVPTLTPYATNEPAVSGGWIIKYDKDSVGDLNISTPGGNGFTGLGATDNRLKIHEPKPNQFRTAANQSVTTRWPSAGYTTAGTNQLRYIVNFLTQMENALYAPDWLTRTGTNHWSYYFDADAAVDFHWIVEFTRQIDGYRLSDYMTKDRNGKLRMEPIWDWNLSFGNADYANGGYTNGWYYDDIGDTDHPWLRRLISGTTISTATNGDPDFTQKIADRWSVLRTNILNGPRVLARIDELSLILTNAEVRDAARFPVLGQTPGPNAIWPCPAGALDHLGNPAPQRPGTVGAGSVFDVDYTTPTKWSGATNSILGYLKHWVMGRYLWIDGRFTPSPTFSSPDAMVTNGYTLAISGPPGVDIYYRTDGIDPRGPRGTTNGTIYTGPITVNGNVRVVARARGTTGWKNTWSGPSAVTFYTMTPPLRITEIMYHPADPPPGSTHSAEDFEYIEVKNTGGTPLNVNRFSLSGGVEFLFPSMVLAAGQSAVIVKSVSAFQSRYGNSVTILGTYTGNLNNGGDHLVLSGAADEPILDFSFKDNWYPTTDGLGFSLVAVDENAPTDSWDLASNWRASSGFGGSPGQNDPAAPSRPPVVINEALTHTLPPLADAIELYNPTATPVDISGWFLSDDFNNPKKYVIPANTPLIPAFGYVVFYETNSFNFPTNGPTSFALSSKGDSVWIFSADGANLTGYAHGFSFGASAYGVSFGRYVISTGEDHFVAQTANTLGAANAGPLVGPMVISEINYHPLDIGINSIPYNDTADEYIELKNIAATNVFLYDPAARTNTWHLRDAVDFEFPTNVTVAPGAFLLIVSFDPGADPTATAAFRARNSVPGGVPLYGPWNGSLDNAQDGVELARPDAPATNSAVEYILVDKVNYSSASPWPIGADGFGLTLQRVVLSSYGNDPSNWVALVASPGTQTAPSGTPPVITSQPGNQEVATGMDVLLSVTATGTAPLRYQWQLNGLNVSGGTNATLSLANIQISQAGTYDVVVYNSAGSTHATEFTLSAHVGLKILVQPASRFVKAGVTTNLIVSAEGSGGVSYFWSLNGGPITATNVTGVNSSVLTITNVQTFNQGIYTVMVTDDSGSIGSQPATLGIVSQPGFLVHPVSTSGLEGGTATFSVAMAGTPPIFFRWRHGSTNITNAVIYVNPTLGYSFLTLTNLQMSDAFANYNVVVTNLFGNATNASGAPVGVSSNAALTVLADADRDGIPDILEPLNGAADNDGDGMSNAAEYLAGTDYNNPNSALRLSIARSGLVTLSVTAVSNRTYTVQYTDSLSPRQWQKLADIVSRGFTRTEAVVDPSPGPNRIYRVVTPYQP